MVHESDQNQNRPTRHRKPGREDRAGAGQVLTKQAQRLVRSDPEWAQLTADQKRIERALSQAELLIDAREDRYDELSSELRAAYESLVSSYAEERLILEDDAQLRVRRAVLLDRAMIRAHAGGPAEAKTPGVEMRV